jgi:ABC-type multidrug transport system ATPase subunit
MSTVLEAHDLGKRYRRRWALADCTITMPAGHVVGLVGPNGAGKTTLLQLAVGLLAPSSGSIEVLGRRPLRTRRRSLASASWPRTRRPTPRSASRTTCEWART